MSHAKRKTISLATTDKRGGIDRQAGRQTDVCALTAVGFFFVFVMQDQSRRRKEMGPSQFLLGSSVCGRSFNGARI